MSRALTFLVAVGLSILTPSRSSAQVVQFQVPAGSPMQMPPARDTAQKTGTARIHGRDHGRRFRPAAAQSAGPRVLA